MLLDIRNTRWSYMEWVSCATCFTLDGTSPANHTDSPKTIYCGQILLGMLKDQPKLEPHVY